MTTFKGSRVRGILTSVIGFALTAIAALGAELLARSRSFRERHAESVGSS